MNLGDIRKADGVAAVLQNEDDDAVDPNLERIKNESGEDEGDEEDEDFVAHKDDRRSPTDNSGGEDSDASENGDAKEKPIKKDVKKVPSSSKASASGGKSKDGVDDGSKKRKRKKKKDRNAPKRALSGFMFFSQSTRENIKQDNPGISFTDVGRVLGDKWKKMLAEEKEPYEAKARADKKRFQDQITAYKNLQPMVDSGNESGSD